MSKKLLYDKGIYTSWLRCSTERQLLGDVLYGLKDKWMQHPMSIIEVGCGSGDGAKELFRTLEKERTSYQYLGIEPSKYMRDNFEESSKFACFKRVEEGSFETLDLKYRATLSVALHSLYYVDSQPDALAKLRRIGEKSLIVHHGTQGIDEVQNEFKDLVLPGPHIISTIDDIAAELDVQNVFYSRHDYLSQIDIRPAKDPNSQLGRNLINFMVERDNLNDAEVARIRKYLQTREDYLPQSVGVIITN